MAHVVELVDLAPGVVLVAATPIGDVADASPRLIAALRESTIIAAEDTRRLRALLERLGVETSARIVSYFDGNESSRAEELVAQVRDGATVLVVSDAGMPCVSDPGYRLVSAAAAEGLRVSAIPGPSAALAALAVSGLASDRFTFEGFAPRKAGERRRFLAGLRTEPRTMIFFEAPHRLAEFLQAAAEAFGDERPAVACRELTKTYEEVRRGSLSELVAWAQQGVRGEVTVVIAGHVGGQLSVDEALVQVQTLIGEGAKLSQAVAEVAAAHQLDRRELYDAALAARKATS